MKIEKIDKKIASIERQIVSSLDVIDMLKKVSKNREGVDPTVIGDIELRIKCKREHIERLKEKRCEINWSEHEGLA